MLEIIFFFGFWIICVWLVGSWSYKAWNDGAIVLYNCDIVLISIVILHLIANVSIRSQYENKPIQQFVESTTELPIQSLTFNGQEINVVVIDNQINRSPSEEACGLKVRRVSDLVPYAVPSDGKLYLVKERGRFWWMFYIFPRDVVTGGIE